MSLKDKITADMKDALRNKHSGRLEAIRLLRAAIQRRELDTREELDDVDVVAVVHKLIKQGQDAAEQFDTGGRRDLADKERDQVDQYKEYLPTPLTADELKQMTQEAIADTGATSIRDMGKVMALLKVQVHGRADLGELSLIVKTALTAG